MKKLLTNPGKARLVTRQMTLAVVFLLAAMAWVRGETAGGALQWTEKKLEQRASWSDQQLTYRYQFTNRGRRPVTLRELATSCGCTELDRAVLKTYQPGETGTLTATYRVGERSGRRLETLMVESDEDGGRVYELLLSADLPELVKFQPAFVHWNDREQPVAKTIRVRWQGPGLAELQVGKPSGENWKVQVKSVESGKSWDLQIIPPTTDGNIIIQIPLKFSNPQTGLREVMANALLQPAPQK